MIFFDLTKLKIAKIKKIALKTKKASISADFLVSQKKRKTKYELAF